jgi:anti-sigma factor RsiW
MTLLTCAAVRRRLQPFYDSELPVTDLIAIQAHLKDCPPCTRDLRELQAIGDVMRGGAARGPADDWTGLAPGVISRMRAEAHESWPSRVRRAFDDMHLVWIGLAATAGTFLCAAAVATMLRYASPERNDSMVKAAPLGSDLSSTPTINEVMAAALENTMLQQPDLVMSLSAVVTRENRDSGLEYLNREPNPRDLTMLIEALSQGQLEPAQFGGSRYVTVLMSPQHRLTTSRLAVASRRLGEAADRVWVVAHTTVKGKFRS